MAHDIDPEFMADIMKYQQAAQDTKKRMRKVKEFSFQDNLKEIKNIIHPGKMMVKIESIKELSHDMKSVKLIPSGKTNRLAPFRAGQYIAVKVDIKGVRTARAFSLASSPQDLSSYELGVKRKSTGFVSQYLFDGLKIGNILEISEPMGQFYHNSIFHGKNLVFIAGGSGITPFMSLMRYIADLNLNLNVQLLYGCLSQKDMVNKGELDTLASNHKNLHVEYILSDPDPGWGGRSGFINSEIIKQTVPSLGQSYYYIVGNRPMIKFVLSELNALGIKRHKILIEAYGVPDDITRIVGWPEDVSANQTFELTINYLAHGKFQKSTFEINAGEPLLNSIERANIPEISIENSCRSGQCALCRSKLERGQVFVPPEVIIRKADVENGFIHPCVSYPLSDLELRLD